MIDRDYSFLRLRNTLAEAKNMNSPNNTEFEHVGQVHLLPGETYVQISNSPVSIAFNGNYQVHAVDECGQVLEEVTDHVFINQFTDSNGVAQIVWEFINDLEYGGKPLILRFTNTVNSDTWFTNPFISSEWQSIYTTRFDYKNNDFHYGTQYDRADYYQSIRLKTYFRNEVNESEREEYHQISTSVTVAARNISKFKERYILLAFNGWAVKRLELMLTANEVYIDNVRSYSSTPIEFNEPESEGNFFEGEMIVNKDYTKTFTFDFQIFEGLELVTLDPQGNYTSVSLPNDGKFGLNYEITDINTGTLTLYNSSDVLMNTWTEGDLLIENGGVKFDGLTALLLPNDSYYFLISDGLVTAAGLEFEGLSDSTVWTFTIGLADFLAADFNSTDFFTT